MATTSQKRGYSASDGYTAEIDAECCQYRLLDADGNIAQSICLSGSVTSGWKNTVAIITGSEGGELLINASDPPSGFGIDDLILANCACRAGNSAGLAEICDKLEILTAQQTLGTSALESVGCVRDGEGKLAPIVGRVFAKEDEDGNIVFILILSDGTIKDPYTDPFELKTSSVQPIPTGEVVTDESSPYCGQPIFQCVDNGEVSCFVRDSTTKMLTEINVGTTAVNWQGDKDQVAGQIAKFEIPAATTSTAADQVAAAIAAEAPVGVVNGKEYTFTIDDVSSYEIRMTGDCPVNVCDQDRVVYSDSADGGVTLDGSIDVITTETPAELTVCFAAELTKAEIAALPDA